MDHYDASKNLEAQGYRVVMDPDSNEVSHVFQGDRQVAEIHGDSTAEVIWFRDAARTLGTRGGKSRSPAKAAAARENGRKGGRPRKKIE